LGIWRERLLYSLFSDGKKKKREKKEKISISPSPGKKKKKGERKVTSLPKEEGRGAFWFFVSFIGEGRKEGKKEEKKKKREDEFFFHGGRGGKGR